MNSVLLTLLLFFSVNEAAAAQDSAEYSSIWDDPNESNPYFKKKYAKTGADIKRENSTERKYYKTTFKRRVYTGPTPAQAAEQAKAKAGDNFKAYLPDGKYDVRFEKMDYDPNGDVLRFTKLQFKPRPKTPEAKKIPYYLQVDEADFSGFNIGEIYGTPQNETGKVYLSDVEIPVWNENSVKVGKVTIGQVSMVGKGLALLKERQGDLSELTVSDLHSEKIINETVLNNIVRSKIFAARSATFANVRISAEFFEAIKEQSLSGMTFSSALINTRLYTSEQAVYAEMLSYSARVLNPELVEGARMEGAKDKKDQNPTMKQIRKNAEELKAKKEKLAKEMKK